MAGAAAPSQKERIRSQSGRRVGNLRVKPILLTHEDMDARVVWLPNEDYLRRLRALAAWWNLGSSAVDPVLVGLLRLGA